MGRAGWRERSCVNTPRALPPAPARAQAQAGIEKCAKLRVLFMSNNKLKDWAEVDRLSALGGLEELLLVGGRVVGGWVGLGAARQGSVRAGRSCKAPA